MVPSIKKKTVLHLVNTIDLGGLEVLVLELAKGLKKKGWEVFVATFQGGLLEESFKSIGVPVTKIPKRDGFDFSVVKVLKRLCNCEGVNLIHSHNYSPWVYSCLTKLMGIDAKLVHTEHAIDVTSHGRKKRFIEFILSFCTEHIIADSNFIQNFLTHSEAISRKKISVIYNGVDHMHFCPNHENSLSTDKIIFIIVARLVEVKNHRLLIDAFHRLVRNVSFPVELWIVGDGPMKNELICYAKKKNLRDDIVFWGNRCDIEKLLNRSDIFVLTSDSEGLPICLLEAAACGLPIVATDVGGISEVVVQGQTGYLVPKNNVEKLAVYMERLAIDPKLRKEMGKAARRRVLESFTYEKMLDSYLKIYKRVLRNWG